MREQLSFRCPGCGQPRAIISPECGQAKLDSGRHPSNRRGRQLRDDRSRRCGLRGYPAQDEDWLGGRSIDGSSSHANAGTADVRSSMHGRPEGATAGQVVESISAATNSTPIHSCWRRCSALEITLLFHRPRALPAGRLDAEYVAILMDSTTKLPRVAY
jgi:hypothetical protein